MDTLTRLKSIPLFAALAPEDLARVAQIATARLYPKGTLLCRQEEFGQTLFIIESGEVLLHQTDLRGLDRPTGVLRAGQFFGEDALLLGNAYGWCAQAITPVEVICIHKTEFDLLAQEHPQVERQMRASPLIQEQLRTRALPGQDPGEPWLLRRGRHWFSLAIRLLVPFLVLLAMILVTVGLARAQVGSDILLLVVGLGTVVMSTWVILIFVDWRNDYYLVTTKKVLHRELSILQLEKREEAPLNKIQNANSRRGPLGSLLGFGTLKLDTAGARQAIVLDYLPDPEGMKQVIFRQASYLQSISKEQEREEIRQELLRRQAGEPVVDVSVPIPEQEPAKGNGALARIWPSRPLLRVKYEQGNQVVWRKHWIYLLKRAYLAFPALLLATAVVIAILASERLADFRVPLLTVFLFLWVIALFWVWWEWTDWRNDEYIVTDSMVIDVTKKPLFFDQVRLEAPLDMIQNISLKKPGFWSNVLDYGEVLIQTAGSQGSLKFAGVHHPAEVQREIFRRLDAYREAKQRREREQKRGELSTWFQVYEEIKRSSEQQPPTGS